MPRIMRHNDPDQGLGVAEATKPKRGRQQPAEDVILALVKLAGISITFDQVPVLTRVLDSMV